MKTALFAVFTVVAFASVVHGLSSGAPDGACAGVSPNPTQHGADPQITPSPYNIAGLPSQYTPEARYLCKSRRGVWCTQCMHSEVKYRDKY